MPGYGVYKHVLIPCLYRFFAVNQIVHVFMKCFRTNDLIIVSTPYSILVFVGIVAICDTTFLTGS